MYMKTTVLKVVTVFFCGPLDNINVFLCIINDVTYLSVALGVGL